MADNENMNTEAIEPVEVVHDEVTLPEAKLSAQSADGSGQIEDLDFAAPVGKSLLGATLGATAADEQEPDEEYETIPVQELVEVKLGRQGENDTQTVVIDCSAWLEKLPGCTLMIAATRPGEREIYLPEVSVSSGVVTWPILEQDTACAGVGRAEVRAMKDGKVKKSALFRTRVEPALEGDGSPDAPTPPNWVKLIIGSVEASQQAAEHAEALVEEATACAINAVRFDENQGLTDEQKAIGRGNIDAAGIYGMVSRYAGRRVSILGDSISSFGADGYRIDGYRAYYPALDVTEPEQTWWMKVIGASGGQLEVNASWDGSCASNARAGRGYPDFFDRCGLLGSPDVIFVALGTNDSGEHVALGEYDYETAYASLSEATFRTAYIKGVKALKANYPGAEIVLVIFRMADAYAQSVLAIGDALGVSAIDARGYTPGTGQNIHPGVQGMRDIASRVLYPAGSAVRYDAVQTLTEAQRQTARENIGAAGEAAMAEALAGKVAIAQGAAQAGLALIVGEDGNVTTGEAGISEDVKVALLDLVRHVAYTDDKGQDYYDALYAALYGTAPVPPSPILYQLRDRVFDGVSDYVDTGLKLLETDRSFTIVADVLEDMSFSGVQRSVKLFHIYNSSAAGVTFGIYNTSATAQNVIAETSFWGRKYSCLQPVAQSGHRRLRIAISHEAGESNYRIAVAANGAVLTPASGGSTEWNYASLDNPLTIGAMLNADDGTSSLYFKGTVNEFIVYNYAFTSAEVSAYVAQQ